MDVLSGGEGNDEEKIGKLCTHMCVDVVVVLKVVESFFGVFKCGQFKMSNCYKYD